MQSIAKEIHARQDLSNGPLASEWRRRYHMAVKTPKPPDRRLVQRFLSRREVADMLNLSPTTLWRLVRDRRFPPPVRISPGRVGWLDRVVWQWMDERDVPRGSRG